MFWVCICDQRRDVLGVGRCLMVVVHGEVAKKEEGACINVVFNFKKLNFFSCLIPLKQRLQVTLHMAFLRDRLMVM